MGPVTAVVVGAGQRGHHVYGAWAAAHPAELAITAVLDPDPDRVARFRERHPAARPLSSLDGLAATGAQACIVAAPDRDHHPAASAAMAAGMHVLLEKPIAATIDECADLARLAGAGDRVVHVAHVLRATEFFRAVRVVISSGRLGDVVTVAHRENVAAWHMAHSFVRGNWSRRAESTPMIVAKCCHDLDILSWIVESPVTTVFSHGTLFEFHPKRAPEGAAARCTDPCPVESCPYDARAVYLDPANTGWPVHVITDDLSMEGRLAALATGPYGRCAYLAGSDVVDHQVVAMATAAGTSMTLTMHGHSPREERTIRVDGTRATLRGRFGAVQELEVVDHRGGASSRLELVPTPGGHGGGDTGSIRSFLAAVRGEEPDPTPIAGAMESHYLGFAAEESRLSGRVIDMASYRDRHPK